MKRSGLEQLSQEELIELVLELHETLQDVRETNRTVTERVYDLEEMQESLKKTSKNSSSRPSSDRKGGAKWLKKGKKRGAKAGHRGCRHERSEPDVVIECKVEACSKLSYLNASERALHNSVIHRKISGRFRFQDGADARATIASVVTTATQNGLQPFDVLAQSIGQPIPLSV